MALKAHRSCAARSPEKHCCVQAFRLIGRLFFCPQRFGSEHEDRDAVEHSGVPLVIVGTKVSGTERNKRARLEQSKASAPAETGLAFATLSRDSSCGVDIHGSFSSPRLSCNAHSFAFARV
jgi:hypothetical protein